MISIETNLHFCWFHFIVLVLVFSFQQNLMKECLYLMDGTSSETKVFMLKIRLGYFYCS